MRIGIVGLGLIGGTIAKSLKNKYKISAFDISNDTLTYATNNNIIDEAFYDIEEFIKNNDVFYLCLYPKALVDFLSKYKNIFPKGSLVIEISGVKEYIVNEINNLNIKDFDVVFSHPVAGSEKVGVYHSNAEIFKNANYIITPTKNNTKTSLELTKKLAKEMGFLNISFVTPKEHDDIIAYTSQLTHVISLSLVNSISTNLDTKKFIGDSYRDLTRISKINEKLWPDLFITNKNALLSKIDSFQVELNKFKEAIKMNDKSKLEELMIESTNIRKNIDRGDLDEG